MDEAQKRRLSEIEVIAKNRLLNDADKAVAICGEAGVAELREHLGSDATQLVIKISSDMALKSALGRAFHLKMAASPKGRPQQYHVNLLISECCNA